MQVQDAAQKSIDTAEGLNELAIRTRYVAPGERSRSSKNLPLLVVAKNKVPVDPCGDVPIPLIESQLDRKLLATSQDGGFLPLEFARTMRVTNRAAALALARAGVGAVMVMRGSIEAELATGAVVEVMPSFEFGSIDLNVHFRDCMPRREARAFAASLGFN